MGRVREIRRLRRRVRVGAPDPSLTRFSGMAAVTELVDRLAMIRLLDAAIGPIKSRDRGFTGGQVLVGLACAQLAGEDFLVGLDRYRADAAGQVLAAVPGSGLDDRGRAGPPVRPTGSGGRWRPGWRTSPPPRWTCSPRWRRSGRRALSETVTIDLDTTDVEVYGRHKRGVAFNHQGQRVGRPHVATWAETATVLAADLMSGRDDPRPHAPELLRRALAALPAPARAGRIRLRADAGYFAGELARAALFAEVEFAIGAAPDRAAVADPRRGRRDRLDRRDRHDRRAGRGRRVLPGLVAGGDPAADPPGPPRRDSRAGLRRPAGPTPPHPAPRPAGAADRRARRRRRRLRLLVHRDQPRRVHR